ncbi:MAG: hypothetical protein HY000_29060, partial [Planctomycetes bacterium]|nr:hypothetical protein [Planctomycetota bacterium]
MPTRVVVSWLPYAGLLCGLLTTAGWIATRGEEPRQSSSAVPGTDIVSNTDESEFQVPPGCIVEKVAGQPLINYPLFACFDDQGRLYVAEGTGTNLAGTELEKLNLGKITLLEDTDDDGKFDKSTTFADGLVFPQGVLCHDGAVYVASHPAIWRLVDTDGDGRADRREEFIGKFGFNGNGCDIHGPFLGPDGWIYWTDGRHGHKCPTKEGEVLEGFAARIFRCRPDGTGLERICGGGFDNPVELVFTDTGEMIGTMDQGPGDCLLHYVEGGVYPRDDQPCLKEFPMTGPLLQPITSFSAALPAALCGLVRIRSDHFGPEYKNSLLTTQFNVHRLQQHMLVRDGATFRTINKDFLTSTNYDLRLTDVLEDADGSLLMVDMGAWFNYGCPTAKIAKPEVKGSIYRIRRTDAPAVNDPWGRAIRWATLSPAGLAELLDDPRPMVRDRAIEQLRKRGGAAVSAFTAVLGAASGRAAVESIGARSAGGTSTRNPLVGSYASERSPSLTLRVGVSRVTEDRATPTRSVSEGIPLRTVQARRNAIWALSPIGTADARAAIRAALADEDATVRQVAAHCAGLERDAEARSALAQMSAIDEPSLRARAADALGRIGGPDSVPALIEGLRHGASDRFLEHALIYALIRIADREATIVTLKDPNPQVRRAGLIALDQMKGGQLTRDLVVPLLDTDDPQLQQAALDVISRQEGWANEVITLVRDWVNTETLSPDKQASLAGSLLALTGDATVQNLVADALVQPKTPLANRQLLLGVVARCRLDQIPPRWAEVIRDLLQGKERTLQREAVAVVRSRNLAAFDPQLIELSHQSDAPADLR